MWLNSAFHLIWYLGLGLGFLQTEASDQKKVIVVPSRSEIIGSMTETIILRGVVLDESSGQPVGYANVVAEQSKSSTQTNDTGEFKLLLPTKDKIGKLHISSLGYASKVLSVAEILPKEKNQEQFRIYLKPSYKNLRAVEVNARSKKWRTRKVGFNINKGTRFHHHFSPLDTVVEKSGQEVGNRFQLKKYPALLQRVSFGLAGSGNVKAIIGLRLYSLRNNLPDKNLLSERIILRIPPHHTGWITVDLEKYNLTLQEDFAVAVEWLSETTQLNKSSLMAFAKHPKGQVTYSRTSDQKPWSIQKPTLTSVNSIGLYVTVLY